MDFYEVLDQVIDLLRSRGPVTYRALQRQFHLDDIFLEDLKTEIIDAQRVAVEEDERILAWTGSTNAPPAPTSGQPTPQSLRTVSPPPHYDRAPLSYTPPHLAEKILRSKAALEGERKQVTVLFCDLANSTAIAEHIGPENMHTLLNRFFALALEEVHRYEGTIRYVEEGLRGAQRTSPQKYMALGWALRGKMAAQRGDTTAAGTDLHQAALIIVSATFGHLGQLPKISRSLTFWFLIISGLHHIYPGWPTT